MFSLLNYSVNKWSGFFYVTGDRTTEQDSINLCTTGFFLSHCIDYLNILNINTQLGQ